MRLGNSGTQIQSGRNVRYTRTQRECSLVVPGLFQQTVHRVSRAEELDHRRLDFGSIPFACLRQNGGKSVTSSRVRMHREERSSRALECRARRHVEKSLTHGLWPALLKDRRRHFVHARIPVPALRKVMNLFGQQRSHRCENREVGVKHFLQDVDDVPARERSVRVGVERVLRHVKVKGGKSRVRESRECLIGCPKSEWGSVFRKEAREAGS